MQVIASVSEMQSVADDLRFRNRSIALVPTMGALHEGHVSLIKLGRERAEVVIVSVFVNPAQFGPNEDFAGYPRDLGHDLELCERAGADIVFTPSVEEMYPKGFSTYVNEDLISKPLCGVSRPAHFRGVTTVVAKLLNLVHPGFLVFGQKNAQQVAVVRKMAADLHFRTEVLVGPIVREADGLAMGSRNRFLSSSQRQEAIVVHQALRRAKEMVEHGVHNTDRLVAEATHLMATKRRVRIIYTSIVDPNTMEAVRDVVPGKAMLAVAVWVDELRLIDNILL